MSTKKQGYFDEHLTNNPNENIPIYKDIIETGTCLNSNSFIFISLSTLKYKAPVRKKIAGTAGNNTDGFRFGWLKSFTCL